jgi:hypothetical protein
VDSGIVAFAIGMIATTAGREAFGRVKAGTANGPADQMELVSAASGMERNRL